MAKVDKENGFVSIANTLFDAIIQHDFTVLDSRVLLVLIRFTYGYNQKSTVFSGAIASEATGMDVRNCRRVINKLVSAKVAICHKEPSGRYPGEYGPNKDFDQWQIPRLTAKSIPSLFRLVQISEQDRPETDLPAGSNQPATAGSSQPGKNDPCRVKKGGPAGLKQGVQPGSVNPESTLANAVVEGILRGREDMEDKEDNIYTPQPPVAYPVKKVVVEGCENELTSSNVIHLPLTAEQIWASGRQKIRGQAQAMLMQRLSFGGLPLWATQDLDKLIDAEPPQGWSPKRWFTTLHDALQNAVHEAEQAWIKSSSSVKSGLRIALSRWKTNVSVAISTAAPTQHRGQL